MAYYTTAYNPQTPPVVKVAGSQAGVRITIEGGTETLDLCLLNLDVEGDNAEFADRVMVALAEATRVHLSPIPIP